jgi:alpha-ketoglutarate-dependent dioxygenase FTO
MPKKRKKKRKKKQQQTAGSTWSAGQPGALGWPTEGGGAPSAPGLHPGAPPRPYAPPPTLAPITPAYLLEAGDPHFDECLTQCYRGFVHQPRGVPAPLEARLLGALEALKRRGYFHYDVVRGMGSWVRTFVRRILVGVPGMTYSYLGLRIFAHPWDRGAGGTPEMEEVARANAAVTEATQRLLYEGRGVGRGGRCDYNVTLINLMEDEDQRGGALRNKSGNNLGNAQVAVSWHADSSLEDFSSIAVLNLHATENAGAAEQAVDRVAAVAAATARPFRIALRCIGEGHEKKRGGGTRGTPAVAVALASGDAYYMLNDFNHHHHHAVLAGSRGGGGGGGRYSSTHRVAVTAADTYSAISRRAAAALERAAPVFASHHHHAKNLHGVIEALRESEEVHSELEFEWLRQVRVVHQERERLSPM